MKNPKLVKKVGEVLAFARIGLEFLERSGEAGTTAFGAKIADEMKSSLNTQITKVEKLADEAKAQRTINKLRKMMDMYIGDEWDNPTEILEWSGFYFGSAGIHWSVVSGLIGNSKNHLHKFSTDQADLFFRWLEHASKQIKTQNS